MNYHPPAATAALPEIVVDSFAGGGGASTGIELALQALGIADPIVDIAINHSGAALAMHEANHPRTLHLESDIWTVDPRATTAGRPVGLMWASPDCRHFSRAKGSTPVSQKVRGLAWSIAHWAEQVLPRVIILENVPEFVTWGPLMVNDRWQQVPDPSRAGDTFSEWLGRFKKLGYKVEWKVLTACDYGAPTIRKRLFVIMRRDGQRIVWPKPTHGDPDSVDVRKGKLLPWRTAAEVIDWSRTCASVLMSKDEARAYTEHTGHRVLRPLADNTMYRIAAGVKRFILERAEPFVVTCNQSGDSFRSQSLSDPLDTSPNARDAHGLVASMIVSYYSPKGGLADRSRPLDESLSTITTEPRHGIAQASIAPFLTAHYGSDIGSPADAPMRTLTGIPKIEPVVSHLEMPPLTQAQMKSARRVADFLRRHDAWDDREFVSVGEHVIVDICMRMLTPRELARAQGFPDHYTLAAPFNGRTLSKSDQRHKIGNSVCPPMAQALVIANYRPQTRVPELPAQTWLFEAA